MSIFTEAEIAYLRTQKLGRLATIGPDGVPHVSPVGFRVDEAGGAIVIGGLANAKTKKFRDVRRAGVAAFVVDDVLPPWRPRGIEIRGPAVALEDGGKQISERFDGALIRITPSRIVSWGLEQGRSARSVAS